MDIEIVIEIENIVRNIFYLDIANIILEFIDIDSIYNQVIDNNLESEID